MQAQPSLVSLDERLRPDLQTVPALLQARAERSSQAPALWSLTADRDWSSISWNDYRMRAIQVAKGLPQLGLAAGARVGILAPSSRHWDALHLGILAARGVVVGLDPHDLDDNLNVIARRCALNGLIVQEPSWLARFAPDVCDGFAFVVHLQASGEHKKMIAFDALLPVTDTPQASEWIKSRPEDPATIIFTSGTTGEPKGIQYSHQQICQAVASIIDAFPETREGDRLVCWLPLSNLFQRILNLYAIGCGAQTYYVEDPREIMRQVRTISPHLFIGVPRFYEKLYAGITEKIKQGPAWQRSLVAWALRVGDCQARAIREQRRLPLTRKLQHALADRLVLQRLRGMMGPNLRYLVSGSAPMPVWLLERFHAMGCLVLEAYGLSENIIPVAANRLSAYRFGTVGHPLQGNEIRLAEDGELLVRGNGVFSGYFGEARSNVLDVDGYLVSGDFASLDADGFITLTGRKSEIFKTATGRRIAPAPIESLLRALPRIEQAAVFGAGRPVPVVVLVVATDGPTLQPDGSAASSADLTALVAPIRTEVQQALATVTPSQRPAGCILTTRAFTIETGELTPNLKLRRHAVEAHYAEFLAALYERLAPGVLISERFACDENEEVQLCSL